MKKARTIFAVIVAVLCMTTMYFSASAAKATIAGDINGDGVVNTKDLTRLMKHISGEDVDVVAEALNTNGDGAVDVKDFTHLMKYISGEGTLASLGCLHSMTKTEAKNPACEEKGNSAYWYCSVCKKYFADAKGTKETTVEASLIPATGHTEVIDKAVEPTYETTGLTEGKHCSVCGKVIVKQEIVPVLELKTHSITYLSSDVDLPRPDVSDEYKTYSETEGMMDMPLPTMNGYKFIGWYDAAEGGSKITAILPGSTKDYVLYARWEAVKYRITYYNNVTGKAQSNNESNPTTYTIEGVDGLDIVLAEPIWNGMVFVGWTVGKPTDENRQSITKIERGTTGDLELTAEWKNSFNLAKPATSARKELSGFDTESGIYYFAYELGRLENVILSDLSGKVLQKKAAGEELKLIFEDTISISEGHSKALSTTVGKAVTGSVEWSNAHSTAYNRNYTDSIELSIVGAGEIGFEGIGKVGTTITEAEGYESEYGVTTTYEQVKTGALSTSTNVSEQISTAVEHHITLSESTSIERTIGADQPEGYYAHVRMGNAKVYALIVFDVATKKLELKTYSFLEQENIEGIVYANDAADFTDPCKTEYLPYNVPMEEIMTEIKNVVYSTYKVNFHLLNQEIEGLSLENINNKANEITFKDGWFTFEDKETTPLQLSKPTAGLTFGFVDWYADPEFKTRVDDAWKEKWYKNPTNIDLYARWTDDVKITYTVNYVTSLGENLGSTIISGVPNSAQIVTAPDMYGYVTPESQTVVFDVPKKTITFTYYPDLDGPVVKPE